MAIKILSYIWTVITNFIVLFVVLGILSVAYTGFEKVVLCGLILIYLSVMSFSTGWGFIQLSFIEALNAEFKRIRKLLKNEPDEYEEEELKDFKEKKNNASIKFYINAVFNFIIYIVVIFNLLGVLGVI